MSSRPRCHLQMRPPPENVLVGVADDFWIAEIVGAVVKAQGWHFRKVQIDANIGKVLKGPGKFIVDGTWKYAPDQSAVYDEMGNINNVLEVQEYSPDNLDSLSSFEQPPSPPHSYDCQPPRPDDYAKEPPVMPKHLNLTLLNVPPTFEAPTVLPRPQHVILNHVYEERAPRNVEALVLGTTFRYRSKYITTVVYKPSRPAKDNTMMD